MERRKEMKEFVMTYPVPFLIASVVIILNFFWMIQNIVRYITGYKSDKETTIKA